MLMSCKNIHDANRKDLTSHIPNAMIIPEGKGCFFRKSRCSKPYRMDVIEKELQSESKYIF
jgi:hypothetical protein